MALNVGGGRVGGEDDFEIGKTRAGEFGKLCPGDIEVADERVHGLDLESAEGLFERRRARDVELPDERRRGQLRGESIHDRTVVVHDEKDSGHQNLT